MLIPEIVENLGWIRFRDIESEITNEVGDLDNHVIDTGGGIVLRNGNVQILKKNGHIILLQADVKAIIKRIRDDTERPSLTGTKSFTEEVEDVVKERKKTYEDSADYVIDTSALTVDEVVKRIIRYLKQK
jgi:shikimate kinase